MTEISDTKFSVLISVYAKEDSTFFAQALESLHVQTRRPDELVVVLDGPVPQSILSLLAQWESRFSFPVHRVALPENRGLGFALREGLRRCSHEIVARMDSDDINCPQRFEKQLLFLEQHLDVAAVSSWMACFEDNPDEVIFVRRMPQRYEDIKRIAKFRNPVCHPPVMFRRSAVEAVGGYTHRRRNQDYHLWARMLLNGSKITCIPEPLYKLRCNDDFLKRRTSLQHTISMIKLQNEFLKMGFISLPQYLFNISIRITACILPVTMTRFIRTRLLKL